MIVAALAVGMIVFVFSLYQLFISGDAMQVGVNLLRVVLSVLGLAAIRFEESIVLATAVLMFALTSVLVLAITRSEVQIKHD